MLIMTSIAAKGKLIDFPMVYCKGPPAMKAKQKNGGSTSKLTKTSVPNNRIQEVQKTSSNLSDSC